MNKKKKIVIIVISTLLVIIAIAAGSYFFSLSAVSDTPEVVEFTVNQGDMRHWFIFLFLERIIFRLEIINLAEI